MYLAQRFSFRRSLWWTRHSLATMSAYSTVVAGLIYFTQWHWLALPWQPVSLIGTALAFYLGFKNNSAYDRLWEARKIWGGIVNSSRSFAVMARDFIVVEDDETRGSKISKELVHRHIAWLHMLTIELRKVTQWEHQGKFSTGVRNWLGTHVKEDDAENLLREHVSDDETDYVLRKGNRSSHLLSVQAKRMMALRQGGELEHFRHLAMQNLITEFYTLQGKCERIKKFPLPRQYASATSFCVFIFVMLLPFGMADVFSSRSPDFLIFLAVPATTVCAWVYWFMDRIGEYSENPFEGLANDVPIKSMARSIEIDILQMLDEEDLPPALTAIEGSDIIV